MADTSFTAQATTIVAAWLNQINKWAFWGRRPNYATTTGAANVQILTLETGSLYTSGSEADGDEFVFTAGFTNSGAMTLVVKPTSGTNVARAVQLMGVALTGGEVTAGRTYKVTRLGATWQLTNFTANTFMQTFFAATTAALARTAIGAGSATSPLTTKGDLWGYGVADQRVGVGSDGQAISADSSQASGLVYIDNPSRPNLLINPNWQIDQINEGSLYTVNTTAVNGPDGWSGDAVGAGVFKLRTLADPDNAALKCLEITCTTADASIAATDTYSIYTAIEGYDAAGLMAGTSSAAAITIQFKFKTNVTGVYGVAIANSAKNRSYYGIITVADTNEHEYSLTLTMDTSGTWLYTNGVGLYLRLTLSAGSNFQGTAGAWAGDAKTTTSAQCNFMSANTNVAYLKRVQLMQGSLVQAYKPADINKELAKAQRYYAKTFAQGVAPAQSIGSVNGALVASSFATTYQPFTRWSFPAEMRAAPTVTTYSPWSANANWRDAGNTQSETVAVGTPTPSGVVVGASTATNTNIFYIHASANARLS